MDLTHAYLTYQCRGPARRPIQQNYEVNQILLNDAGWGLQLINASMGALPIIRGYFTSFTTTCYFEETSVVVLNEMKSLALSVNKVLLARRLSVSYIPLVPYLWVLMFPNPHHNFDYWLPIGFSGAWTVAITQNQCSALIWVQYVLIGTATRFVWNHGYAHSEMPSCILSRCSLRKHHWSLLTSLPCEEVRQYQYPVVKSLQWRRGVELLWQCDIKAIGVRELPCLHYCSKFITGGKWSFLRRYADEEEIRRISAEGSLSYANVMLLRCGALTSAPGRLGDAPTVQYLFGDVSFPFKNILTLKSLAWGHKKIDRDT